MTPPRYVMRELTGYSPKAGGQAVASTDFMVLDSFYGYAVVYYDKAIAAKNGGGRNGWKGLRSRPYGPRLAECKRVCAQFNAEEAAQVAA